MVPYFSENPRPDISMAVHKCALYSYNPHKNYTQSVNIIVHYLTVTKYDILENTVYMGFIFYLTDDLAPDRFVDAKFYVLWSHEDYQDPSWMNGHTGFVITLAVTPVT